MNTQINKQIKWTEKDLEYLKNNYPTAGAEKCSYFLNKTIQAIRTKASILEIKYNTLLKQTKICPQCKIEKSISEFYKKSSGYSFSMCKICNNSYYSKEERASFDKQRKIKYCSQLDTKKIYRVRRLISSAKSRAKDKNLEFDLTFEWAMENFFEYCPILGLKLDLESPVHLPNSPSIDRVNNKRGYTKDNCIIISFRANAMKNDGNLQDIQKLAKFYTEFLNNKIPEDYCI